MIIYNTAILMMYNNIIEEIINNNNTVIIIIIIYIIHTYYTCMMITGRTSQTVFVFIHINIESVARTFIIYREKNNRRIKKAYTVIL